MEFSGRTMSRPPRPWWRPASACRTLTARSLEHPWCSQPTCNHCDDYGLPGQWRFSRLSKWCSAACQTSSSWEGALLCAVSWSWCRCLRAISFGVDKGSCWGPPWQSLHRLTFCSGISSHFLDRVLPVAPDLLSRGLDPHWCPDTSFSAWFWPVLVASSFLVLLNCVRDHALAHFHGL